MNYLVFVYGTLKRGKKNHSLLESSEFLGEAVLVGPYQLCYDDHPCLIESKTQRSIYGEVFSVNKEVFEELDELEDHPNWYTRKERILEFADGRKIKAWVYFFPQALLKEKSYEITSGRFE